MKIPNLNSLFFFLIFTHPQTFIRGETYQIVQEKCELLMNLKVFGPPDHEKHPCLSVCVDVFMFEIERRENLR